MRRSAALLSGLGAACALTAQEATPALEEPAWRRQLRPEDESISKRKADSQGVAGGPCYPGKTECPFSTSCEWDQKSEDGEAVRSRICTHKPLVPANGHDIATIVLLIAATALAAGGGIGGGGLLVPIYRLVAGFPITQATALSLATISGGSIANLYTYTRRYHPNAALKRPLIDYEASLLFCPALLAGTMFGSLFSVMFPPWLTVILLIVLLGYSGKRTLNKGIKRWKGEDKTSPRPTLDDEAALEDIEVDTPLGHALAPPVARQDPTPDQVARLDAILAKEGSLVQRENWAKTGVIWLIVFVFALLRGGGGGASLIPGLDCSQFLYWYLFVANLAVLIAATCWIRKKTLDRATEKIFLGHVSLEGDLHWDRRTTVLYPMLCVFAGIAAGLLGIGGGMVLGPLLVELGCLPQPIAATSAYVVFITATSGLAQVWIMGLVPADYACAFAACGLFSTFLGQSAVDWVVKRYQKDAIVILIIASVMLIALVLMTYDGIVQVVYAVSYGFSPLC